MRYVDGFFENENFGKKKRENEDMIDARDDEINS